VPGGALGKIVCGSCVLGECKRSTVLKNEMHVLLWNVFDTFLNNVASIFGHVCILL
jgi:hypothetical protein